MDLGQTDLADAAQFDEAYRRLTPIALAIARGILRDDAAAEDVVQDIFTELWLHPAAWNPRRASLTTYVAILARSRALDRQRARTRRSAAVERTRSEARTLESPSGESAVEPVLRRERSRGLIRALAGLPREQRSAVLAYGGGYSVPEIARASGVPVGTAKSRLRLGLLKAHADPALTGLVGERS